jgi:hypothetical protein
MKPTLSPVVTWVAIMTLFYNVFYPLNRQNESTITMLVCHTDLSVDTYTNKKDNCDEPKAITFVIKGE